jgi:protein TonB
MRLLRKFVFFILAAITSVVLIFSIPILNMLVKGGFSIEKTYTATEVRTLANETPPEVPKPKETARKPARQSANNRTPKAGPRFAINLDVMGGGGAIVPKDLVAMQSGSGNLGGSGNVDEKPNLQSLPRFNPPEGIREAEINSSLRISFCVNTSGRPYDIRIVEENPAGKGLANAGRDAVMGMLFSPAKKDGAAVPFCGLEQPFEIKFRE